MGTMTELTKNHSIRDLEQILFNHTPQFFKVPLVPLSFGNFTIDTYFSKIVFLRFFNIFWL